MRSVMRSCRCIEETSVATKRCANCGCARHIKCVCAKDCAAPHGAVKFTATCPDGTIVTRTSDTMSYIAAILLHDQQNGWGAVAWSQSFENAARTADRWRKYAVDPKRVRIVAAFF